MSPRPSPVTRRQFLRAGVAASGIGLAGCSSVFGDASSEISDWPAAGYDERNSGYVRDDTAPPDEPERLWTFETAFRDAGAAAVSDETVFHVVGRRLYALDRLDGTVRWKTAVGTWGSEAPILVDGTLYVGWSGGVRAVDATTGDVDWTFDLSGGVYATPAYDDGTVVVSRNVGSGAGRLVGLRDGDEVWEFEPDVGETVGPTAVDGTAYVGTRTRSTSGPGADDEPEDQAVFAVSVDDGSETWSFSGVGDSVSTPAVADGRVFVGCADGHLYAVDAAEGAQEWRTEIPLAITSAPTVVEGVVYVGSTDGHVYAVDADTGDVSYRVDVGAPIERGLSVVDEVNEESQYEGWRQRLVYAGTRAGTVAVVKTETQSVLSTVDLGASVEGPPFVRDRLVHVATNDGNVHVLGE